LERGVNILDDAVRDEDMMSCAEWAVDPWAPNAISAESQRNGISQAGNAREKVQYRKELFASGKRQNKGAVWEGVVRERETQ
jgi:hypothetical protein